MTKYWIAAMVAFGFGNAAAAQNAPTSPFDQTETVWLLSELDGQTTPPATTLSFAADGRVSGKAPCNRFMGQATWTPDALEFGPLGMTMMACPDLSGERAVMKAFASVVAGGILEGRLILTMENGSEMVFTPDE